MHNESWNVQNCFNMRQTVSLDHFQPGIEADGQQSQTVYEQSSTKQLFGSQLRDLLPFLKRWSFSHFTERLWVPDVFFRNEKDSDSLNMEDMSDSNTLTRLTSSGSIWYVRELTARFRCNMDLHHYPMGASLFSMYISDCQTYFSLSHCVMSLSTLTEN